MAKAGLESVPHTLEVACMVPFTPVGWGVNGHSRYVDGLVLLSGSDWSKVAKFKQEWAKYLQEWIKYKQEWVEHVQELAKYKQAWADNKQ